MGLKNNFRARSLITEDSRLTLYEGVDWGELYDLAKDPHEMNNLWDDPQSHDRRYELTEKLARKMMELADSSPLATHHECLRANQTFSKDSPYVSCQFLSRKLAVSGLVDQAVECYERASVGHLQIV